MEKKIKANVCHCADRDANTGANVIQELDDLIEVAQVRAEVASFQNTGVSYIIGRGGPEQC
jgi:hypothetical protein